MMTSRSLRIRSINTPACRLTSANGKVSSATSTPICIGVADSSTAAVSGSARFVTCAPNDVTVIDVHTFTNSASRHRPRPRRRARLFRYNMMMPLFYAATRGNAARTDARGEHENSRQGTYKMRIPA